MKRSYWLVLPFALAAHTAHAETPACGKSYESAQELRLAHKLRDAMGELATCSTECSDAIRSDCTTWMHDVSLAMPSIIVVLHRATGEDAHVTVDGAPLVLDGTATEIDPGSHYVVATDSQTHASVSVDVTVAEGEKGKRVELELHEPDVAPAEKTESPPNPAKQHAPWYTWAVGGVGVAAIINFAAWGIAAVAYQNELRGSCYGSCTSIQVERVHNRALVADVSLGIGLATLAAAAIIYFLPRKSGATTAHIAFSGVTF